MKENVWQKIVISIEKIIPMKLSSLVLFLLVLYFIFIVGRAVYLNHGANKEIEVESAKVAALEEKIAQMKNQINYLQTYSFREKEARSKLGYKAVGEKMMAVPIDKLEEKLGDAGLVQQVIKVPNYINWWKYYTD